LWDSFVGVLAKLIDIMYNLTVSMGIPSYGLAIILFTTAVRLLMFPLNLNQAKSTRAMSLLQPKMKQLQTQYKNSPEILNREVSALYKKYNVNPLAGCLPLVIQLPLLMALLGAIRSHPFPGSFLWLESLSQPDSTLIMPIVVGLSSFLQSKVTMASQPAQSGDQAKMMNRMMLYVMPVMLGFMSRSFEAGVALYWTVFNILGFLLQMAINAMINRSHTDMQTAMDAESIKEAEALAAVQAEKDAQRARQREAARKTAAEKRRETEHRYKQKKGGSSNKGKALDFDDYK
jgi:YidC/Oxa1 family membrane protein insertase